MSALTWFNNVYHFYTGTPEKSYSRTVPAVLSSWMGDWYWWWYLHKT